MSSIHELSFELCLDTHKTDDLFLCDWIFTAADIGDYNIHIDNNINVPRGVPIYNFIVNARFFMKSKQILSL